MTDERIFQARYLPEAETQLLELAPQYREKILEAISTFEKVGTCYKNINDLGNGLFEIKPKGVRAYFMYDYNLRRIIIIGFICLKTTQKAPERYMKQARKLIEAYLEQEAKELANERT